MSYGDIPAYRIKGDRPELRAGMSICLGVSTAEENQGGLAGHGIAAFYSELVRTHDLHPHILANDTGNRFRARVGEDSLSENDASLKMKGVSQNWMLQLSPVFAKLGIRERAVSKRLDDPNRVFLRWEDFRVDSKTGEMHREFCRTLRAYELLAELDRNFADSLEFTADMFMQRRDRDNLSEDKYREGITLCRDFLIEENAIFTMCGRRFDAFVYPGPRLPCQLRAARGEFDIPADLPVERLPAILREDMQLGATAADTLREALSGFDRMQWIELRKSGKYVPMDRYTDSIPSTDIDKIMGDLPEDLRAVLSRADMVESPLPHRPRKSQLKTDTPKLV